MAQHSKNPVIIVTDGDHTAFAAVEKASMALDLYVVKESRGNPTPLSGKQIIERVREAPKVPVVVMVDDSGDSEIGRGEKALQQLLQSDDIDVLGVVAVAANTRPVQGVNVDVSVTQEGTLIHGPVDKQGNPVEGDALKGDTLDVLRRFPQIPVVGLGDPGKMEGADASGNGVPRTKEALQTILERSGWQ